jgi:hypothetical protein
MSRNCSLKKIVPVHVIQIEIPILQEQKKCQIMMYQMIKINIIIDNIMQHPVVVIGKTTISQIRIIDISNEDIIKILDFNRIVLDVIDVKRKAMSRTIVLYGRKLLKKRRRILN